MIGAGPANLALAVAIEECDAPEVASSAMILEQHGDVKWQRSLLLPWTRSQVSYGIWWDDAMCASFAARHAAGAP